MNEPTWKYAGMVSSDWSECLSPNGPFDPISYNYPHLKSDLSAIFRDYTGNKISLADAVRRISALLGNSLTVEQMDSYLSASFRTYTGVPELIEWCLEKNILFMINTTGTQGYFQRALDLGLLPPVQVISANPLIRFPGIDDKVRFAHQVLEIEDKPRNTEAVVRRFGIEPDRVVIMGDSGGDGPHFAWGADHGAHLVGCMPKHSLESYCRSARATIHKRFGISYGPGESRRHDEEMKFDFLELRSVIQARLG